MEIKGIELELTSSDFSSHCARRAEFHAQRAREYLTRADDLRKMRRENPNPTYDDDNTVGYGKSSNYADNPVEALEKLSASHRQRAERFRFMSEHAIGGCVYRLEYAHLAILEIGV